MDHSLHEWQSNAAHRNEQPIFTRLACAIAPNSSFLLMRAHVIAAHLTGERHGQLWDNGQFERLSSFEGKGVLATAIAMIICSY